jgi:uroporphyrin-III C-methyltransferase
MNPGKVTLVGAGPGDPELLTVKAVKALQAATVLLVDDLVSDDIVALANPAARVVYVGKRGGCKSTPQAFIQKLMIAAAQDGDTVVRLKGGDPFIFGRGGEEVEDLRAAGFEVTVVNGITSGLAAATALGVPLTHRELQMLRDARLTLVIYMGVSNAQHLQDELCSGLAAATPVAVIQNASLPEQRHVTTELGQLARAITDAHISSPAIIVVGEVTRALARAAQAQATGAACRASM